MHKLIAELTRLYLMAGAVPPAALELRVLGQATPPVGLVTDDGRTRAIVIPFYKMADGDDARHWTLLCEVANALQTALDLPAPAVSISGADGYALWLSLGALTSTALVQQFLALLRKAYFADAGLHADAGGASVELPPHLHAQSGRWAAFINPGLGAAFIDEAGLEMAPPLAGQVALLEGLHSISEAQFQHALNKLQQTHGAAPAAMTRAPAPIVSTPNGLLLKDATLDDIVRHLHARNIEPSFRYLIPDK